MNGLPADRVGTADLGGIGDVDEAAWSSLRLVADPQRRAIYTHLRGATAPMSRDQVAAGLAIARTTAAFHLDRLAESGLLAVTYARPAGRGGPGAGRPAKLYQAREVDLEVAIPARRYERLARILVQSADLLDGEDYQARAQTVAFAAGERDSAEHEAPKAQAPQALKPLSRAAAALRQLGYEPAGASVGSVGGEDGGPRLVLRNCPFRRLSATHPEVVCTLNERYVAGVIDGLGLRDDLRVAGEGVAPACCVIVAER
ncbi:Transcriptional regulator [Frankia canadensis]|uniref:Transcriptional regulator n=1 Tax=Frankia canadensis TaxID=1836972 RepID=A0A2I2KTJ6_9ACTN|nr:helix-turn-helix domain-containing protein [Frankia canadensis]SNQ48993.1 Transcriptional regulator [Frankia canadensis]SOU56283.1 Transcriptional regulator [Frankia canadensis]